MSIVYLAMEEVRLDAFLTDGDELCQEKQASKFPLRKKGDGYYDVLFLLFTWSVKNSLYLLSTSNLSSLSHVTSIANT